MILLKTATNSKANATQISKHLIENKLAACCQVYTVDSRYWWYGEIVNEQEWVIEARCSNEDMDNIVSEIKKIHNYKLPEIILTPMIASENYDKWCAEKDKYEV